MTDLVLIVATLAFVAICVAYIGWCDRIIGPDEPADGSGDTDAGNTGATDAGVHAEVTT